MKAHYKIKIALGNKWGFSPESLTECFDKQRDCMQFVYPTLTFSDLTRAKDRIRKEFAKGGFFDFTHTINPRSNEIGSGIYDRVRIKLMLCHCKG